MGTERLDLFDTDIGGTLPSEIGTLTKLRNLLLEDLDLTGTIPTELGNLSDLGKTCRDSLLVCVGESSLFDFSSCRETVFELKCLPRVRAVGVVQLAQSD